MNLDADNITVEILKESLRKGWWEAIPPSVMAGLLGYGAGDSMESAAMGWTLAVLLIAIFFCTWILGILRGSQTGILIAAHIYEREEPS